MHIQTVCSAYAKQLVMMRGHHTSKPTRTDQTARNFIGSAHTLCYIVAALKTKEMPAIFPFALNLADVTASSNKQAFSSLTRTKISNADA